MSVCKGAGLHGIWKGVDRDSGRHEHPSFKKQQQVVEKQQQLYGRVLKSIAVGIEIVHTHKDCVIDVT